MQWEYSLRHTQLLVGIGKHTRNTALHDHSVLKHIRHSGGIPEIVLKYVERAIAVPDEVGAGNMAPDSLRRQQAETLWKDVFGFLQQWLWYNSIVENLLFPVETALRIRRFGDEEPQLSGNRLLSSNHECDVFVQVHAQILRTSDDILTVNSGGE